jgi:hypothetical protein
MNSTKTAIEAFDNFDRLLDHLLIEKTFELGIEATVSTTNLPIRFCIAVNDLTVADQFLETGNYSDSIMIKTAQLGKQVSLEISLSGKGINDTVVDQQGKIIKDTFVVLDKLYINNFDILSDYDFFYNKFQYVNNDNNHCENVKMGFWSNSTLRLDFDLPFAFWYANNSDKNSKLSGGLQFSDSAHSVEFLNKLIASVKKLDG